MATAAVHAFHAEAMREAKRDVGLRIANGTKSSNPAQIGYRRNHRSFNGIPYDSQGSKSVPFFVNTNQRDSPFASMTGGVIKNYKYAKELLGQRAESSALIDALVKEVPPPEGPLLQLSDAESKSLELNSLLNSISDEVEAGNVSSVITNDLKNVLRLYIALMPTFDGGALADFQRYFEEVEQNADVKTEENPQNKSFATVRDFMGNLFKMTAEYAPFAEREYADKILKIRDLLKRFFRLNKKEVAAAIAGAVRPQEEEADDGGMPPPQPPGRGIQIAAAPQPDAVIEEAEGVPAAEGGPPPPPPGPPPEGAPGRRMVVRPKIITPEAAAMAEANMKAALYRLNVSQLKEVYQETLDYPSALPEGVTAGNIRQRIIAKLNRIPLAADPVAFWRKANDIAKKVRARVPAAAATE